MSDTLKPPAPAKWAMEAAQEYAGLQGAVPPDDILQCATIIQRHHAAAQAETVALLEECAAKFERFRRHADLVNYDDSQGPADEWPIETRLRTHLAQLKEGAP